VEQDSPWGKSAVVAEAVWDALHPAKPAQKILMNPIAQPGDFRYMDPPNLPPYIGEFLRYLVETQGGLFPTTTSGATVFYGKAPVGAMSYNVATLSNMSQTTTSNLNQ
jgi:hypothetical protein